MLAITLGSIGFGSEVPIQAQNVDMWVHPRGAGWPSLRQQGDARENRRRARGSPGGAELEGKSSPPGTHPHLKHPKNRPRERHRVSYLQCPSFILLKSCLFHLPVGRLPFNRCCRCEQSLLRARLSQDQSEACFGFYPGTI